MSRHVHSSELFQATDRGLNLDVEDSVCQCVTSCNFAEESYCSVLNYLRHALMGYHEQEILTFVFAALRSC
jgi:hypothetical protein